ncbi:MAG TPA: phosphoenolpyruvate carboxylase, partial [Magnetospirillaceae bacterium]|nr:phosphoenolpyruvate carboxylase [Magnetospirillaceae bacterium]
ASHKCLDRIYRYYRDFVVGKQSSPFSEGDITIAEWIGEFKPERINVIPLFEDMEHLLDAHIITREYLRDKNQEYQRVFLARSDPAMNYGLIPAVLLNKMALQRLHSLSAERGVRICPIVGVGSAPFRGNLRPQTVNRVVQEYPSVHTFTIQSAFKYDNPPDVVRMATKTLQERDPGQPQEVDEGRCMEVIRKCSEEFRRQILLLAPIINRAAKYIPSRRKRKLHTGLFGYSRSVDGITLPRAITFTAALYSIGLPPEILGLNALDREDLRFVRRTYLHFDDDLRDALRYFNPRRDFCGEELEAKVRDLLDFETDGEHGQLTSRIAANLLDNKADGLGESILRAASLRKFLG